MVFSTLPFLYLFLPICISLYTLMPGIKAKNAMLTAFSLVFYAWGEPVWVLLLVFSAGTDYICGLLLRKYRGTGIAKGVLAASLTVNISLLATFKYLDFFLDSLGLLLGTNMPLLGLSLPIGISFYTFQTMSYTIDVYRGKVETQRSFLDFLLFVSLFPQLVAGPILRYADLERQLTHRVMSWEGCAAGIARFACGLGKKVLLANTAGKLATTLLDGDLSLLPAADAWFGLLMFAAQIYFDFSGYSDMAIGLGRMFGFRYGENFRHPYTSVSVTDFWRRWHISLGAFFRDYVYIPLGGNRKRQIRNLLITWGLTGLWHGASWNFVLWGLYYFGLLVLEKFWLGRFKIGAWGWLYTFPAVLMGWALFYFTDFARLGQFLGCLFGAQGGLGSGSAALWLGHLPLLLFCALGSTYIPLNLGRRLSRRLPEHVRPALQLGFNLLMLALSTAALAGQSYNPFLYFRF